MANEEDAKNGPAYSIRIADHPGAVDALAWDALLERQPDANPFLRHAFLAALHDSGSATAATGWQARFVLLHHGAQLVGACPLYGKTHSYGEYVFDWAWADAYQRHGLPYYPKLLGAIPFTPVPGPRLMADGDEHRQMLLHALTALVREGRLSSVHLLFLGESDRRAVQAAIDSAPPSHPSTAGQSPGWMLRSNVQFHWQNRAGSPWPDFPSFLADLQRDKRKKIQQERRRVADAGVTLQCLEGAAITAEDWDHFHRCYVLTYAAHHSTPYLSRDFFHCMAQQMPEAWMMVVAWRGGERVAASLIAIDRPRRRAWGRYWGALQPIDCLHFEACYYQPLAWCIEQGFERFEGGAQGEHKMARGLLPVQTWSAHWLAHPQFAQAVADFLAREGAGVESYLGELNDRKPFKASTEAALSGP